MYFSCLNIFLIVLLWWTFQPIDAYYYCGSQENALCFPYKHFICNVSVVPMGGTLIRLCPMTRKLRNFIVEKHNIFRNQLAGGEQNFRGGRKFPKATRMREVLWDDELAYIAGEHAKRCKVQHDKCRSTQRFQEAGQNLYMKSTGKQINITDIIVNAINGWWYEAAVVDDGVALANKFPDGADFHAVGHFTAMANERAAHVGCGISLCESCGQFPYCVEVTCNYSITNIEKKYMYKVGDKAATDCKRYESTPSTAYSNLCVNTGKIFNNRD